ncbi:glucose transport protein-like [Anopheles ziemanni]|uniref:glucose transport protein-like n=1 Tax=Anopheles coustani TaxID=139045 RepID=UPI002659449F|nr:glucose transport protein-like [Anopheles coustani]XP_058175610.1 glucose transport protein-like [Anopheles ziemanni]
MVREVGNLQTQSSTMRILTNQCSNNSTGSTSSTSSEGSHKQPAADRWMGYVLTIVAVVSYVTAGLMLGWSNGAFQRFSSDTRLQHLSEGWRFSLAATPALLIAVIALAMHRFYYWIGTKAFLLTGSLLAVGSMCLEAFARSFWWLSAARILAGISTGLTFTLVPPYVEEFGIVKQTLMSDLLSASFPIGVLIRFAADWLLPVEFSTWASLCWAVLPACCFVGMLLLPESARFLCATDRLSEAASVLQRTNALQPGDLQQDAFLQSTLSRWQQPNPGLLEAVRNQGNLTQLVPLLALFTFQAFVGVLPMLFYLTNLLELAGSDRPSLQTVTLMAVFVCTSVFTRKVVRCPHLHRPLLATSSLLIAVAMFTLGWHIHLLRIRTSTLEPGQQDWSLPSFALVFAAYALGFHRQPQLLLQSEVREENLFGLRTLAVAICWASVYIAVRLLPFLLRTIGAGWLLWNTSLVALFAALFVYVAVPRSDGFAHKTLPPAIRCSSTSSSSSSTSATPSKKTSWTAVQITPDHFPSAPQGPVETV